MPKRLALLLLAIALVLIAQSPYVFSVAVTPFVAQPNQVVILTDAQATWNLTCRAADVYLNGILQSEGVDYTLDSTGLSATFSADSIPQPGDVVKIAYRC